MFRDYEATLSFSEAAEGALRARDFWPPLLFVPAAGVRLRSRDYESTSSFCRASEAHIRGFAITMSPCHFARARGPT